MKRPLLISILSLSCILLFAFFRTHWEPDENLATDPIFYAKNDNPDWLIVMDGISISAEELIRNYKHQLGLTPDDELVSKKTLTDELGFTHYRYQQYNRGLKVAGGELWIHERNGQVETLNGRLVRNLPTLSTDPIVTAEEAIQASLDQIGAEKYMWENPFAERMTKKVNNDPEATFYPQPELVIADPDYQKNPSDYQLAYHFIVYSEYPHARQSVFVDARSGEVLRLTNMLHSEVNNTPATAETVYSGTQTIVTDSVTTDSFRLVETTRGRGIETYDMNRDTSFMMAVDFTDEDNYWNNINPEKDQYATDAHWGAEMTFDYFEEKFNYIGVDGDSMPLISFVHFRVNLVNAFWNGNWATFGDGNGSTTSPLTSLDVVGHEFAHGVTDFTANLIYQDESGALNESFSDIFGTTVEFFAEDGQGDWLIGEDFHINSGQFRSMSNPKSEGDPDTYQGINWIYGNSDNGGVHTNSGVQNHWFYLLTEGGSGINDNGEEFDITALGIDTAAQIAFRNLKFYLLESSTHIDAREGAVQAAADLYGACSPEMIETTEAWYAVGVGIESSDYELKMLEVVDPIGLTCGLPEDQQVTVTLTYNARDCNAIFEAGDKIPMGYQVNGGAVVSDTLELMQPLVGGDTLIYTFPTPTAALSNPTVHELKVWSGEAQDRNPANDTLLVIVDNILDQNVDITAEEILNPVSGCFLGEESMKVRIGFLGCDSIPAGEELTIFYQVDDGEVLSEITTLPQALYRGGDYTYLLNNLIDVSTLGRIRINAWVTYGPDFLQGNDSLFNYPLTNPFVLFGEEIITFEGQEETMDSLYATTSRESQVFISDMSENTGEYGIQMTGGDFRGAFDREEAVVPSDTNVWEVNELFKSELCFCVDGNNLATAQLAFDLKQTFSPYYVARFGDNNPYASPLRVLANGEQISETFVPNNYATDPYVTHLLDLTDYLGGPIEICFETRALLSREDDPLGLGDRSNLDNITFGGMVVSTEESLVDFSRMSLFPNPNRGQFTLRLGGVVGSIQIDIRNIHGQLIQSVQKQGTLGEQFIRLDAKGIPSGLYMVIVRQENGKQEVLQMVVN